MAIKIHELGGATPFVPYPSRRIYPATMEPIRSLEDAYTRPPGLYSAVQQIQLAELGPQGSRQHQVAEYVGPLVNRLRTTGDSLIVGRILPTTAVVDLMRGIGFKTGNRDNAKWQVSACMPRREEGSSPDSALLLYSSHGARIEADAAFALDLDERGVVNMVAGQGSAPYLQGCGNVAGLPGMQEAIQHDVSLIIS